MTPQTPHQAAQSWNPALELDMDATGAISGNDAQAVWSIDFLEKAALLSLAQLGPLRSKLLAHFGAQLGVRLWDAAIREQREKLAPRRGGQPTTPLPLIQTNAKPMREGSAESLRALVAANTQLYVRGGAIVALSYDEKRRPSMAAVSKDALRGHLDRAASYMRVGENGSIAMPPPAEVVADVLSLTPDQWGLPALDVLVEVPTLKPTGAILTKPGYDPISRMLYIPTPGFEMRPIPDEPCTDELTEAVATIDEAIEGFPLAGPADRANLFGLFLTPIIRPAISGSTPLALIDAPQAGTGKSLLADVFSLITTGRPAAMSPFPRDDAEIQKSVLAKLAEGTPIICYDNLDGALTSPTLALVMTALEYTSRVLGKSESLTVPNRATWLATGNNIRPGGDMPRRCYHIRIDAESSTPYIGRKFAHEDLRGYVMEKRPELLRALLLMARGWFARGCPSAIEQALGSFEHWHQAVAGILHGAGVEGFLTNLGNEPDEMSLQWEGFLDALLAEYPDGFTAARVADRVRGATALVPCPFTLPDSLGDVDRKKEGGLERALSRSFGKRLGKRFGTRQLRLERALDSERRVYIWSVRAKG
jgi:hypothetical protein